MGAFREFFLIVAGGCIGATLGLGFGALVGLLSPDFIALILHFELQPNPPVGSAAPLGAAMGMVCGLPIGATAMVGARLIGAVRHWAGIRDDKTDT